MKVRSKSMQPKTTSFPYWLILILLVLVACETPDIDMELHTIQGETMGTLYTVKVLLPQSSALMKVLPDKIETTLDIVNDALSNWKSDSEVSDFNASTSTDWQKISPHFYHVMQEASMINKQSQGRFDVTLSPLINLWGFGPDNDDKYPSPSKIGTLLQQVGQSTLLALRSEPLSIRKNQQGVTINLSAIAKGYAVDQIALMLSNFDIENFLVEIGGDLITSGVNVSKEPWRVGIEKPDDIGQSVQVVIPLSDMAVATSGDYRKYFLKDGKRMSHIIDPVNGYPVTHNLASVTVVAKTAMRADGLATALMVLGEKDGIRLAEKLNIAAYFITRNKKIYGTSSSHLFSIQYPEL